VMAVATDVDWWNDAGHSGSNVGGDGACSSAGRAEVLAAGLRNGGVSLIDTRQRRWMHDAGGRMSSLVSCLYAMRRHPGHLIAAAANGSLARFDIRNASVGPSPRVWVSNRGLRALNVL